MLMTLPHMKMPCRRRQGTVWTGGVRRLSRATELDKPVYADRDQASIAAPIAQRKELCTSISVQQAEPRQVQVRIREVPGPARKDMVLGRWES